MVARPVPELARQAMTILRDQLDSMATITVTKRILYMVVLITPKQQTSWIPTFQVVVERKGLALGRASASTRLLLEPLKAQRVRTSRACSINSIQGYLLSLKLFNVSSNTIAELILISMEARPMVVTGPRRSSYVPAP